MPASLRVLLIVSLAINLFLIGAAVTIVGGRLIHRGGEPWMGGFAAGGFPPPPALMKALPPESRARLAGVLKGDRQEAREAFRAAREARTKAFEAFIAEPYSAQEMDTALGASHAADLKALAALHDVTSKIVNELSPDERKGLATTLKACYAGADDAATPAICHDLRRGPRIMQRSELPGPPPPSPPPDEAPPPP